MISKGRKLFSSLFFFCMQVEKILSLPEWLFVVTLSLFITFLAITSYIHNKRLPPTEQPLVSVLVTGAVTEEKQLQLPLGASVADVLSSVTLTAEAALEKLLLRPQLKQNSVVIIPVRGYVSIYLQGAVIRKGVHLFPEGATYKHLVEEPLFLQNADLKNIKRRRRLLKEGESITIPTR